jgi:hypothetical protein
LVELLAPFVHVEAADFAELPRAYQVGVGILETQESTVFAVAGLVVGLDALLWAVVEAAFPLTEQTDEEVLAYLVARIASTVSHVPVVLLRELDESDQFRREPLIRDLSLFVQ